MVVRAIANSIEQQVGDTWQRAPRRVEGQSEGNWIVMDYGDVIVHVFMPKEREYYGLGPCRAYSFYCLDPDFSWGNPTKNQIFPKHR